MWRQRCNPCSKCRNPKSLIMRVFKEEQAFRQWWLFAILVSSLMITLIQLFSNDLTFQSNYWDLFGVMLVSFITIIFWVVRLQTRIDSRGINTRFSPLKIFKKHYSWKDISQCYVRKYSPLTEYGGWGIRGLAKGNAYNVSGNIGIQIITKDRKNFLIGTNKPGEARQVIKRYQEKFQEQ